MHLNLLIQVSKSTILQGKILKLNPKSDLMGMNMGFYNLISSGHRRMIKTQCHLDANMCFFQIPQRKKIVRRQVPRSDGTGSYSQEEGKSKFQNEAAIKKVKWMQFCLSKDTFFLSKQPIRLARASGLGSMYIWLHGRLISWNIKLRIFVSLTENIFLVFPINYKTMRPWEKRGLLMYEQFGSCCDLIQV